MLYDTYLVIPAVYSNTCLDEVLHSWAAENNLELNCVKSKELIFTANSTRATSVQLPSQCRNIERLTSFRILGIVVSDRLTATEHVNNLVSSCSCLLYALRVLRSHGIPVTALHGVFRATVVAKVTYGAPAWSGMCTAADRDKLNTFINRCKRIGFCDKELPPITELFGEADDILFNRTLTNMRHVLQTCLSDRTETILIICVTAHTTNHSSTKLVTEQICTYV